jgi:dipeptidyl-peptidase-4
MKRNNSSHLALQIISWLVYLFLFLSFSTAASVASDSLSVARIFGTEDFSSKTLSGLSWIPHQDAFTYMKKDTSTGNMDLWCCNAATGLSSLFLNHEELQVLNSIKKEKRFAIASYKWAPDGKAILLPAQNDLFLFDLVGRSLSRLTDDAYEERDPQFSPDGKRLAFLKRQNLVVLDIAGKRETPLTTEGNEDILIGRFDWVYEEEFGIRTGFEWSPDSRYIAYFRLDQSGEPDFPIVDFIPTHNAVTTMKYPKAGDANALVKIAVVDVATGKTTWMDQTSGPDDYISRIEWTPDSRQLAFTWLNREQNQLKLFFADVTTGVSRLVLSESISDGWLEPEREPLFVPFTNRFLWLSERDRFNHLYMYDYNGKLVRQLTSGSWDICSLSSLDNKGEKVLFSAARQRYEDMDFYSVDLNGKGMKRLSEGSGTHSADVAPSGKYFIDTFSSKNTPTRQALYDENGRLITALTDGKIPALAEIPPPGADFFTFPSTDGNLLRALMIKPVDFDSSKKYPVLMYTYAGPGSQAVANRWLGATGIWYTWLTQKGYVIFIVDGRGSLNRGRAWKHMLYRRMGDIEIQDQIEGAKYLQSLPFVDRKRIGIWGWSYGGYTTVMCLLKGAEYFKMGVAVAPVTDWRNYDTIYTERHMGQPGDNESGYQESSAIYHASKLKGKLLLIHGSSDDNVHFANTLQLAEAFQNARIPFDLMVYPYKTHGIGGKDTQVHLYEKITRYILENL